MKILLTTILLAAAAVLPTATHAQTAKVDSGVGKVVRKQEAGWSYIKSGI